MQPKPTMFPLNTSKNHVKAYLLYTFYFIIRKSKYLGTLQSLFGKFLKLRNLLMLFSALETFSKETLSILIL